jgi:hypothetical protein
MRPGTGDPQQVAPHVGKALPRKLVGAVNRLCNHIMPSGQWCHL